MDSTKISQRLRELRLEFDKGRRELTELESRRWELEATLLRIEGAIQVLTEVSSDTEKPQAINSATGT